MDIGATFPSQKLPFKSKGKKWRRSVVDWAAAKTYFNYSSVRKDVVHMKINYDLMNGILHMEDVAAILNPGNLVASFVPDKIQHYPIINSKINTLRGEEAARVFDWRVIVTNPYSVSDIEEQKRQQFNQMVQSVVEDQEVSQEEAGQQLREGQEFFSYKWQDMREIRANELLRHYAKEQNFKHIFNDGFVDAAISGTEVYYCGISGGEPFIERLNPMKLRCFGCGHSNRIEDADVVVYEDYWQMGRVLDTFYDDLTEKDLKYLNDDIPDFGNGPVGALGNESEAYPFVAPYGFHGENGVLIEEGGGLIFDALSEFEGGLGSSLLPYDLAGNVRVVRVWWKSQRKIYKVKSFDPMTGEEVFEFYPETYVADEAAGEEATPLWVNEAWEGTKIGEKVYVRMRPCLVQFNSISNPSRCHFGIVGSIYNLNEAKPYTLVDMMKPYSYLYDAISAKLVDMIASNWGKILEMDLAMKPKNWEVDKWMYFARANKVLIKDSFNEGDKGSAMGKLAGGLNNASKGYIDADWGNSMQQYINLLQWIKDSMSDMVGINRQREGNTYSRETVGGIERAVLQSSYITDYLFQKHDDTKRRVLTAFLEQAKASLKGRSKKFQYLLSDGSMKVMEIDGDEFAENDYGLVLDNSEDSQKLNQQIEALAQAAVQNQALDFSTILKLYSSASLQEKMRLVDEGQRRMEQRQQEAQQQQSQLEQQKIQAEQQIALQKMQHETELHEMDNAAKIQVAEINSKAEYLRLGIYAEENDEKLVHDKLEVEREKLAEEIRQFDAELRQKDKELNQKKDIELKKIEAQKQIAKSKATTVNKK